MRYKIFAFGCGSARPQISISFSSSPGQKPEFKYVYTHDSPSNTTALMEAAQKTADVFVGRNLDLSTLSYVIPLVSVMPNMSALRFDQCRVDDFLTCLKKVDTKHRSKITYLTIDNTVMTKDQLVEIVTLFSQLETLTLVGIEFNLKHKDIKSVASHTHLKRISLSIVPLTGIDQDTILSFGGFMSQLFCKVTSLDLTSFPLTAITPFLKGVNKGLTRKIEIIIGRNPIEASLKSISNFDFKREASQDLSDWMSGDVTVSTV